MNYNSALKKYFGYTSFRPGQEEIIKAIIEGRSAIAILPTGGGKSLCYQIPALLSERYSIVISPLIALMKDQVDSLNRSAPVASFINSSLDYPATEKVLNNLNTGKIKLLYVSPEKLENQSFTEKIKNFPPEYLFIDEAHCISEWGHNFRPSYRRIINFVKYTGISKISAFTATATEEVRTDIIKQLELKNAEIFVKGFERINIALNVIRTARKKDKTLEIIKKHKTPAIIYASTRENCEEIAFFLNSHGINAAYYHAGLTSELRKIIQDDFLENRVDIISATNAFGMGIDKQNIRLIIHYNMTGSIENYYQEFGRAGRDGREADVFLLYDKTDESIQKYFIENAYPNAEMIKTVYNAVCDYARLAVGNIYNGSIPFDQNFYALISQKGMSKTQVENAVGILESSGYLKKNSAYEKSYYAQIIFPREKLESYIRSFAENKLRDLLLILLRHSGAQILNSRAKINPGRIGEELSLDIHSVSSMLDELSNLGIISLEKPVNFPSVSVPSPRVKTEDLNIDTLKFEELTKHLNHKLDSMIEYVNSEECRFRVILKYFGEEADNYKCGKCDLCKSPDSSDKISLEFFNEKTLETVHEAGGKINSRILLNILRGKDRRGDLSRYSNFGCAKHFSKEQIEDSIQHLIAKDILKEKEKMLCLNDKGKDYFTSFEKTEKPVNTGYEERLKLFNLLRNARKEASVKYSQPPHMICSDEILKLIADEKPSTPAALTSIEGFSQRMFNKIGDEFLSIIKEEIRANSAPPLQAHDKRLDLKTLVNKGYKLEEISSLIKTSEAVVSLQIESLIKFDPSIEAAALFTGNELKLINEKIKEGLKTLKELKENLPSSISYAKIRIALAAYKS